MKILILTQYYPPETGAPQNRLSDLARRMHAKGFEVTVLTAMPNYPKMEVHEGYKGKLFCSELLESIKVLRSWIYVSKSKSIFSRLLNYYSFVVSSFFVGLFKLGRFDYLMVESPPLFLGKTAWLLSGFKGAKLIFNVSDLWPESAEKLGLVTNKFFLRITYALELFCYRRSTLITGQTQGIVADIQKRTHGKDVYWLPNGVDASWLRPDTIRQPDWRRSLGLTDEQFVVLYAGIVGHAQGLEVILKAAQRLADNALVRFVILGSGPEKEKLQAMSEQMGLRNVLFVAAVGKNEMPGILASVDATVIPLRKLDLFMGAIPSKIFESLAMKKPILLGVDGESRELFINNGKAGLYFEPENDTELSKSVLTLLNNPVQTHQFGENGYDYVLRNFDRGVIAEKFMNKLKSVAE